MEDAYGKDGDVLAIRAASRTMNPTLDERMINRALSEDRAAASSEFLGEWRDDILGFVSAEAIDACVIPGRFELLHAYTVFDYRGFVDPSGGSADSMTLAIAHCEKDIAILDCVREVKPPFSPDSVVEEFVKVLQSYGLHEVEGDKYAGAFCSERFERLGIRYKASERSKSDIYRELLPLLNSKCIELLDNPRLMAQLAGLERRTARGGKDSIDHAPGGHDDLINAAAGALVLASGVGSDDFDLAEYIRAWGGPYPPGVRPVRLF
jgi:hypothetical protein